MKKIRYQAVPTEILTYLMRLNARRFGKSVQLLCTCCFMFQMIVYMAIVVYAPALALAQVPENI